MGFEDVKTCCYLLNSSKITERKKAAEQLSRLLHNNDIVTGLNHQTKNQNGNNLNWDRVFQSSAFFLMRESEKLENDERTKENPSQNVRSNWANTKMLAISLPKLILMKSCQESPHINVGCIEELVLTILNRKKPYLLENYAGDAIQITQKYLLAYPQYYTQITQEKWNDLLRICLWIYDQDIRNLNLVSLLSVVEGIIKNFRESKISSAALSSPSIALRPIAKFLSRSIKSSFSSKQYSLQGALLSLLFTVCSQFGSQWRCLLCSIAEEILEDILTLWENKTTKRQILLLRYLNLQLVMHSSKEGKSYQNNETFNSACWQRQLKQLYILIFEHVSEIAQSCRVSGASCLKESIPHEFEILAARLCSQIFNDYEQTTCLDITQIGGTQTQPQTSTYNPTSKRRKVEIGFSSLVDKLRDGGTLEGTIPWYRILYRMLKDYSEFFASFERSERLLDLLLQVLPHCRSSLVIEEILKCLNELSKPDVYSLSDGNIESNKRKWTKVAELTIRLIAGKQSSSVGMQLLHSLIRNQLVYPQTSLYKMYLRGVFPLNVDGLKLLQVLLMNYPLPKEIKTEDYIYLEEEVTDSRISLLNMMFPLNHELENKNESTIQFAFYHPAEVSNVTALLSLKNPLKVKEKKTEFNILCSKTSLQERSLVEQYFENFNEKSSNATEFILDFSECKLINTQINVMDRMLLFIKERVINVNKEEQQKERALLTLDIIEMIVHLWPHLEEDRRLIEEIPNMKLISNYIEKLVSSSSESSYPWNELMTVISKINHVLLLAKNMCLKHNCQQNLQSLLELFSIDFQNLLLKIIKGRENSSMTQSFSLAVTQLSRSNTNQTIDFDPDFDDMECEDAGSFSAKDLFEDICDKGVDEEAAGNEHLRELSRASLTIKDATFLSIVECLGKLYEFSLILDPSASEDENSPFVESIKMVGELTQSEKTKDHIIVLEFSSLLFTMQYSEENIEDGLKMISRLSSHHSKNAKVISSAIKKLNDLLIANGKYLVDEHQQNVVHLLKLYSEKYTNGWYGLNVSELIFDNVTSIVKLDPLRTWSTFIVSENDTRMSQIFSLLRSPFHDLRMKVVENIPLLFNSKNEPLPLQYQKKNFEQLYQIAIESLSVEGNLSAEFVTDEGRGRVNSFLLSLMAVVTSSAAMEPQALYAIISSAKVNHIDIEAIKSVLKSISLPSDVSLCSYLESHFRYLLNQWRSDKHPLEEFPYQIFDESDYLSFAQRYTNQIVSSLFILEDGITEIESLAQILKTDMKTLLENNFSFIMAYLMPFLVASKSDNANNMKLSKQKISCAQRKWKYLENVIGCESLTSHIGNDIGEVVLNLLRLSHDPTKWSDEEVVVPPAANYFESEVVVISLNYAHNLFFKNETSMLSLLCERKSSIQSVLQGLFSDVAKSLSMKSCRLRLALAPFSSFLLLIISGIEEQLKDMEHFLIRKLVYILTNFITDFSSEFSHLAEKCCTLLHDLILACLNKPSSSTVLISTLSYVVTSLHSLNSICTVWNSVYKVLLPLFHSDYEPLKQALAKMAPFPVDRDDEKLKHLNSLQQSLKDSHQPNVCLRKSIESFVEIPIDDVTTYDMEYVVQLLTKKKLEIGELYSSVLSNGLNIAHLFIYNLISIVSNTSDEKKCHLGLEAVGKLGPVSLGTSVFLVPQESNEYFNKSEETGITADVLIALNRLTFARSLSVVDSCAVALRRILSLRETYEILAKDLKADNLCLDLLPFLPARKPKSRSRQYEDLSLVEFENKMKDKSLWMPNNNFDSWLIKLTVSLIEAGCGSDFYNYLIPVCELDVNFCKQILPYVFLRVLKVDAPRRRPCVSKMVSYVLQNLAKDETSKLPRNQTNNNHVAKSCLRILINVINFLRTKDPSCSFTNRRCITSMDRNLWLDLDFLMLAKAAYICGSLYSAILFAELACEALKEASSTTNNNNDNNNSLNKKSNSLNRYLPPLQTIAKSKKGEEVSNLLLQASNALCDSEGVEGCGGLSSVTDGIVQSTLSLHRGLNAQALYISDAIDADNSLVTSLQSVGMYGILHRITQSTNISDTLSLEAKAECAWRLGQWEEIDERKDKGFNQCLLNAFKSLKERDVNLFHDSKKDFYHYVTSSLKESGIESTSSIYPLLGNLQMFSELSEVLNCISVKTRDERVCFASSLESSWDEKETYGSIEKMTKERILSSRISSIRILLSTFEETKNIFDNILFKLLVKKCELGTIRDRLQAVKEASNIKVDWEKSWSLKLEEVKLALALDNKSQAICSLENILQDFKENRSKSNVQLKSHYETLAFSGRVLMQSRTRSPKSVIENYFKKAIVMIEKSSTNNCCEFLEDCYHNLASFGDSLYQEVKNNLSSDHFQSRRKQLHSSILEVKQLEGLMTGSQSSRKGLSLKDAGEERRLQMRFKTLNKDVAREQNEITMQENEAQEYLNLSLENYLKVVTCSSKYDLNIFRVIALWLENLTSYEANCLVNKYSSKIKSHKFIPLLYQLVARLTCIKDPEKQHETFNDTLSSILKRVCTEHPHHGLPVVLMLANSHLDEDIKTNKNVRVKEGQQNDVVNVEDRVEAAQMLVEQLKRTKLRNHISELQKVYLAYITLANRDDKKSLTEMTKYNSLLMKLRNLEYTSPLTHPIVVQNSAVYSTPLITSWGSTIASVGGVNHPLKLTIFSSDGRRSYELLKGNDDLRQDAVLEQVFSVVNELLRKDQEASKQSLSVNTYIVCPLSQITGLIQWCDNTMSLAGCFIDSQRIYYPKDLSVSVSRNKMIEAAKVAHGRKENGDLILIQTLEEILDEMRPVFRYFLYDQYPQPEIWFTRRRSYTRSVATSSIAGYVLGLGDRHCQNILLDTRTAEVIHIDLGIAFENGKLLPTPERVPFRLTQNVIDGFGAMGVEGPLRKNMETTMRVLRKYKSVLITIVDVLRHDPLHHWTLSPIQIAKLQKQDSQETSFIPETNSVSMAERALIRVQQKLNGIDNGLVVSVPEHVSILIQQATDIKNLACMFSGWQSYL